MIIDISNTELSALLEILDKEISELEKEIHRTDALTFKRELQQKAAMLNELKEKLQKIQ